MSLPLLAAPIFPGCATPVPQCAEPEVPLYLELTFRTQELLEQSSRAFAQRAELMPPGTAAALQMQHHAHEIGHATAAAAAAVWESVVATTRLSPHLTNALHYRHQLLEATRAPQAAVRKQACLHTAHGEGAPVPLADGPLATAAGGSVGKRRKCLPSHN
jgi:hypothetical protein